MQRMVAIGMVVALLTIGSIAAAQEFTEFRSKRYDVVTNLPAAQARPIAEHMDKVFDEYVRRLARAGFRSRTGDRMNLYLFDSARTYQSTLAGKGIDATGTGGMFFVRDGESGLATYVDDRSHNQMIATLQHEGFHQFAYMRIGTNLPSWANEGLAEYFGDALLVQGKFALGQVDGRRLATVRKAIEDGHAFGFGELLNMSDEQWLAYVNAGHIRAHLMYDQSWAIVHFLVHGDQGRFQPAFMNYLREINKGRNSAQAFEAAFGSNDYAPFEQAWKRYIADLEADSLTLANERVSFLAAGMRWLARHGESAESLDELQRRLQANRYWMSVGSHGITRRMKASDDTNFQPPPPDRPGRDVTLVLEANRDDDLPHDIVVRGLRVEVRTKWSRDEAGQLSYEIIYH